MGSYHQKFHKGDLVRVAEDLGPSMAHFSGKGELAHVVGSYHDQFGGGPEEPEYTLLFKDGNTVSWYYEHQLTFIRYGGEAEMQAVKASRKTRQVQESDLDWILLNWPSLRESSVPSATIIKLASLLGWSEDDLWGAHGEGITFFMKGRAVIRAADKIIMEGADKDRLVREMSVLRERLAPMKPLDIKVG